MKETERLSADDREFLKKYDADKYEHPSVTADMLIFTTDIKSRLKLLLIKRKHSPYKDCWAIPGGFVNNDESVDEAAARELKEETGIEGLHMEQLYTFGEVDRDPRTRVISVAYLALIPEGTVHAVAGDDAADAGWFTVMLDEAGNLAFKGESDADGFLDIHLAFDHEDIVRLAIQRMRGKISYTSLVFNFLHDTGRFSIYELQRACEAVLGKSLDTANFRRSFLSRYVKKGFAEETGEKCTEYSRKASKYYRLQRK